MLFCGCNVNNSNGNVRRLLRMSLRLKKGDKRDGFGCDNILRGIMYFERFVQGVRYFVNMWKMKIIKFRRWERG